MKAGLIPAGRDVKVLTITLIMCLPITASHSVITLYQILETDPNTLFFSLVAL